MIPLKAAIDRLAAEHAPCLLIACGLGYATPEGTMTNLLAARSETPDTDLDEIITALAGLKQTFVKMCEAYADSVGMDVDDLLSRVESRVREAPLGD
ncbi:MAG: hypothetical protein IIB55_08500 [Planctomycetes bacterium]|nr:hypothetical protein [Planctomycetota bacterium]